MRKWEKSLLEIEESIKKYWYFKGYTWEDNFIIDSTELLNILVNKILLCFKKDEPASTKIHKGYWIDCDKCGLIYEWKSEIISYDSRGSFSWLKNPVYEWKFTHQKIKREEITENHLEYFENFIETYNEIIHNPTLEEIIKPNKKMLNIILIKLLHS